MNFLAALIGLAFTTLVILPVIMFAGVITFDWWPLMLFVGWSFIALVRGKIF